MKNRAACSPRGCVGSSHFQRQRQTLHFLANRAHQEQCFPEGFPSLSGAIAQCFIILFAPLHTGLRPGVPPALGPGTEGAAFSVDINYHAPCTLPWSSIDSSQLASGDLLDPHTFHLQFIKEKTKNLFYQVF